MKQWKYAWGWKAAAFVINLVCSVMAVISLMLCLLYVGSGGIGLLTQEESFEDTEYYRTEVREQVYRCIRAASRESKFENNGQYDAGIQVNLKDYVENNRILNKNEETGDVDSVYYNLSDLLNWNVEGVQEGELLRIEYQDGKVEYHMQKERAVEAYELVNESEAVIVKVDSLEALEERYAPVGYKSLIDYAVANQISVNELQDLYENLKEMIPAIYNDYYAYEENLELFSPGMTNMRYMIIPVQAEGLLSDNFQTLTYTNLLSVGEGREGVDDFLNFFRKYSDYLIYWSKDMNFEKQNMPVTMGDVSSYLKAYAPSVDGDYIFAVGIDPAYQASDNLQAYKLQFEQLKPVSEFAFYGLFLGLVLYFLSLVYLTLAAGHQSVDLPGSGIVHLRRFDHVKTEIAALIVCLPTAGVITGAYLVLRRIPANGLGQYCLLGGLFLFLLDLLFLWGYLSLVRRVKGKNIWTNSVLCSVLRFFNAVIVNRRMTTRAILEYLLFLAANCVLLMFGLYGFLAACLLDAVVGVVILNRAVERQKILDGIHRVTEGDLDYHIPLEELHGENVLFARAVNNIGEGLSKAVAQSVKDEKLKSDLITNVSHDIKTPLTSIINYVDLLKREEITGEKAQGYIAILEEKAHRLKHLTEDLVEASKISSGNVTLEFVRIQLQEMIQQTNGEFYEKFEAKGLQIVTNMPKEPVVIEADGRRLWRIIENLYSNVAKYAMPGTRVYVDMRTDEERVYLTVKNISEQPLNIDAGQLTERFIRGDVSRSSEGSGLGLSIAKNLTQIQKGTFEIYLDGDLFRVTISFPLAPKSVREEEPQILQEGGSEPEAEPKE